MRDNRNPHSTARDEGARARRESQYLKCTVISAPSRGASDETSHFVLVKPNGDESVPLGSQPQFPAELPITAKGDVHVPPIGTDVLVGERRGDIPIVETVRYSEDDTLYEWVPGERRIGHPLSDAHVFFDENGVATIEADDGTNVAVQNGTVVIDGGTNGVITDVSTTKDADGHVTGVSVTRNSSILV